MDNTHIDVVGDKSIDTGSTSASVSGTSSDQSKYQPKAKIFSPAREISLQNDMKLNADRLYCPYNKPAESKPTGSNNDLFRYLQPYFPAEILNGVYQSSKGNHDMSGMSKAENDEPVSGKSSIGSSMQGAVATRLQSNQAQGGETAYDSSTSDSEKKSAAIAARCDEDKQLTFSSGFGSSCDSRLAKTAKMAVDGSGAAAIGKERRGQNASACQGEFFILW